MVGVERPYHYKPAQLTEVALKPETETTEYKRNPVYSRYEWLFEFITSVVALGLIVGIVGIFLYMDNEPLSTWTIPLSLNTIISIMTSACTAALIHGVSAFIGQAKWLRFKNGPHKLAEFGKFDEASRGIWGSLVLITTVPWSLATLGAIITILCSTVAPFAQQVIRLEPRDISSAADTATFGYAHNYSRTLTGLANSVVESIPQDAGMQSAILQGLYGVNHTEKFTCPGACSWNGSYISLGFKASCKNVTQETMASAKCDGTESALQQCNMTTPNGVGITYRAYFTDLATAYNMNTSSELQDETRTKSFAATLPELTRFAIYRSTPDYNFRMRNINITQCSLSITAYEYTGAKANGTDFSFASKREVDFGVKDPWSSDPDGNGIYTNETTNGDTKIPSLGMSMNSLNALVNFFESTSMVTEWVAGNYVNKNLGFAAALSGDVDLNDRFNQMATAMTDYLRYGPNTKSARGEQVKTETYVVIRWWYFIAPIVIEVLGILFAVLSISSNRKSRRVPLWKSSALPVLACQHDEQRGILQSTGKDLRQLEAEAESEVWLQ